MIALISRALQAQTVSQGKFIHKIKTSGYQSLGKNWKMNSRGDMWLSRRKSHMWRLSPRLRAVWNHQLPRVARLTVRAGTRGNAEDLIEDDGIGIVRLNRWPEHLRGQVRYLGTIPSEDDSNYRLIRFEASPAVVQQIQEANGMMFVGRHLGTVQSGKRPVKRGSTINYVLQK